MSSPSIDCVRPQGHSGRCRDSRGCTWENNHKPSAPVEAAVTQPDLFGVDQ